MCIRDSRAVGDAGDPTFSGFATMCLGDIARAKKDNAAAGAFYRELAEKFPASIPPISDGRTPNLFSISIK